MYELGFYPYELSLYQETSLRPKDIEEMGYEKAYWYFLFMRKQREEELKKLKDYKDAKNAGGYDRMNFPDDFVAKFPKRREQELRLEKLKRINKIV